MMPPQIEQRTVDRNFEQYNAVYEYAKNSYLLFIAIIIMFFGLVGFVWALPFPHLGFLGKYVGYLNWASFLIAALIYYHLRLSPMVSYFILFMLFGFSYGIISLEQWEQAGGPPLWLISMAMLLVGMVVQFLVFKSVKAGNHIQLLVKALTWLTVVILKKINIKY